MYRRAFPDIRHDVIRIMADGDFVTAHFKVRGTHQGEFMGIAPTGKPIEVSVTDLCRFVDGKLIERWGNADELGLMRQLEADAGDAGRSTAADAVAVAAHVYKPLLDNDRVRVLESTMKPGDKTTMHAHPALVAVALDAGRYSFTIGGERMEVEVPVPVGQPMYFDAVEHATECLGTASGAAARTLLIELKG